MKQSFVNICHVIVYSWGGCQMSLIIVLRYDTLLPYCTYIAGVLYSVTIKDVCMPRYIGFIIFCSDFYSVVKMPLFSSIAPFSFFFNPYLIDMSLDVFITTPNIYFFKTETPYSWNNKKQQQLNLSLNLILRY